ncbi:MAG: hypothetical protein ACOYZ8_01415 [Chloroflexota bacterium]
MKSKDYQEILKKSKAFGKWIYITPVSGVILTKAVKNEFQINKVILISKDKLRRVRKRFGFKERLAELEKRSAHYRDFFNVADTYAIAWYSGSPEEVLAFCRKLVRNELAILTLSQLGYGKRKLGPYPTIQGEGQTKRVQEFLYETNGERTRISGQVTGNLENLALHGNWLRFQRDGFFAKLLKVLRGDIHVSKSWRESIERASILIGQGLGSNDIAQSFLWNMIALESLFHEKNERFSDEFPKRAEAFLGWVGFWRIENYAKRIIELYGKRCDFVHEGKRDHITVEDLLFTDNLVFNLINNVIQHIGLFSDKQSIIQFSKKVEAEYFLGVKPKIRPKTLSFMPKHYYDDDLKEV